MLITSFYGLLIVLASVAVATAGLLLTRHLIPLSVRERPNATTGTINASVYVMFGVTVAFSLFLVWPATVYAVDASVWSRGQLRDAGSTTS